MEDIDVGRLSLPDNIVKFVEESLQSKVMVSIANSEQTIPSANTFYALCYNVNSKLVFDLDVICKYDGTVEFKQN